ncbi:MAG: sodium/glutamate symporter [Cloacibacillus porcorum]|uniref:sodium/glutamate symporter n=1 Tax=Cloacibacillus porcorum TaxID=1197717 RepID=UPI0023553219|nr:sodium/glutamate symporter [Cloacibacillus porcorum]MCI5865392.1 sodium/glutamate symporter [Cloacibacillus porcorum]
MTELNFNLVETVAFATAILWLGMFLRKRIFFLSKYNIPAPVIGGVIFALASWALKDSFSFNFDMVVKDPLMITFFTSIGLAASFKMLKQGGPQVFIFLIVASVLVLLQNVVAVVLSYATGIHPLLGMLAGSITMSGGHGTGAVYAALFEKQYCLAGGMELAMAAATFGLVMGSILGGPVARRLIERNRLSKSHLNPDEMTYETVDETLDPASDGPVSASVLMTTLMQITIAMSVGAFIYEELVKVGIQLPTYLCALFVGIFIRNFSDMSGLYKVHLRLADTIGAVALSLFLALSLMSLKLWQLADLAGPMALILFGETLLMGFYAYFVTFNVMRRDYTAAVISGGHCGFGLGATPNAIANMDAITSNYGPAPRAFFVVSIVGAFFIDIVNAIVIQSFVAFL